MSKRAVPELLTTADSLEQMEQLIQAGADAFHIGDTEFGMRMPGNMDMTQVGEAIRLARGAGKKVYVAINNLLENDWLESAEHYLERLAEQEVDAIVCGDPAVLSMKAARGWTFGVHWTPEMTLTSHAAGNFWADKGVTRLIPARELNLEEIHHFIAHSDLDVQVQVHGMTNIYHSRRLLISSYLDHRGVLEQVRQEIGGRDHYLIEQERRDLNLPIFEDRHGTHIMSPDDLCLIDTLDELLTCPPASLKIEGLLKSTDYMKTVVACYREMLDEYAKNSESYVFQEQWLSRIQEVQPGNRELNYGFFYKEQVY